MYAFFMEAASIEYHIERYCDLKQLGGLLDSKGYGIALPKDSPYTAAISAGVLSLQEDECSKFSPEQLRATVFDSLMIKKITFITASICLLFCNSEIVLHDVWHNTSLLFWSLIRRTNY